MLFGIQILRGVAAVMVVIFHAGIELQNKTGTNIRDTTTIGAAGVDVFFVISGFIMIHTTADRHFSPREFLYRRIGRVVPLYWAVTLLFGALALAMPDGLFSYRLKLTNYVSAFGFFPTYDYRGEIAPPLNQGWTLVYEMFFYLFFAIASALAFRRRIALLAVWFGLLIAIGRVFSSRSAPFLTYTDPILFEFLFGCAIAELALRDRLRFGAYTAMALMVIGMVLLVVDTQFMTNPRWRVLAWGIPAALIVAGAVRTEHFFRVGSWRVATVIGDSSYSLYLVHTLVLTAVGLAFHFRAAHIWHGLPMVPVMIITSVGAGLLCWRYVERPLFRGLMKQGRPVRWRWFALGTTPAPLP